jgi:hypothetical protein
VRSRHRHPRQERPMKKPQVEGTGKLGSLHPVVGASHVNPSPQELRIRFWNATRLIIEARWLLANGWRRTRTGWLLPDWHPHKRRAQKNAQLARAYNFEEVLTVGFNELKRRSDGEVVGKTVREPYDQQHAVNSQHHHGAKRTVQTGNGVRQTATTLPSLARMRPYVWSGCCVTNALLFCGLLAKDHWISGASFVAGGLALCVTCWLAHVTQRDIELDQAEQKLGKT